MTQANHPFSAGDWIVHQHHGIGQIKGIETRCIGDEANDYYRIEIHNGTIWIPVDQFDPSLFRALATPKEFEAALAVIQSPPKPMAANFRQRHKRIKRVKEENSLVAIARLLRDLWARRQQKSLTNTEESAWRRFTKRFLAEWSAASGVKRSTARQKLYDLLRQAQAAGD